jgi:hypothetical protein
LKQLKKLLKLRIKLIMGGGGSKPKASDRSLEVEQQIIQR